MVSTAKGKAWGDRIAECVPVVGSVSWVWLLVVGADRIVSIAAVVLSVVVVVMLC